MSKRAEDAALKAVPVEDDRSIFGFSFESAFTIQRRKGFQQGYEQAEKDIITLIESRLSELLGDAQPTPILRAELRELIDKIMEENNEA